jgi:DNA-binding transcriptional LysR family regulator
MDRLTSMAVFVKAADLGSFAAAADAMNLSPQMISKHIVVLEMRLGTRLLHRTTRTQSLTDFGRIYYERCKLILAEVQASESLAAQVRAAPRGRLRVTASVSFGAEALMPMMAAYLHQYPDVQIDLALNDRFVDLVEEGYDIGFRIGPAPQSNLVAQPLRPFRLVACASPGYLEERGYPVVPSDLTRHECLLYLAWSTSVTRDWWFERNGERHQPAVSGPFRSNDAKTLYQAALQGLGIAFVSDTLASEALTDGRLVKVLPDFAIPPRPMHLLTAAGERTTPKLRTFIDAALDAFAPT